MVGVCPRGDQVRLSGETKEKPLSSSSTSTAFSSRHFFYPWPNIVLPTFYGFIVPLHCQPLGPLAAPTHAVEEMPHRTRVVAYSKLLPDHLGNAIQCSIIFCISIFISTLQQCLLQTLDLLDRQAARTTWQSALVFVFSMACLFLPIPYAPIRDTDHPGNYAFSPSFCKQFQGSLAPHR
jgi:hypothetical protein